MKRTSGFLSLILVLMLMVGAFSAFSITASAAPGQGDYDVNGDGKNEKAYKIYNANDLLWFAKEVNGGNTGIQAVLMNDIDLSTVCSETLGNWTPIGTNANMFRGSFDGRGFTVENLYYNNTTTSGTYVGLFGAAHASVIRNVTVTGTINAYEIAGGIIGKIEGDGVIKNCVNHVDVTVHFRYAAGITSIASGPVDGCVNYGDITALSASSSFTAGIVGQSYAPITNCLNVGNITTEWHQANGIAHIQYKGVIENCLNTGTIKAEAATTGVILEEGLGSATSSSNTITNSYSTFKTDVGTQLSGWGDIRNGKLAYDLGEAWGQEIGVDSTPIPGGMKVYRNVAPGSICTDIRYAYSNTQSDVVPNHDMTLGVDAFENGVCINCGYECTHDGALGEYSNITNTTHDAYYSCCKKTVTAAAHGFNAEGLCECGTQAVASVKVGSTVTYYVDIYEAAAYAVVNRDSVMTLLSDVELSGVGLFSGIDNKKSVTLDLNGKTLLKTNDLDNGIDAVICWDDFNYTSLEHSTLTINDSLGGGRVVTTQWHALYTTSSLVINGGTFEGYNNTDRMAFALTTNSISSQYGHTVTINGGTFIASYGVSTDNFMTVTINGGTFQGLRYDFHNPKELYGENSPYGGVVINSASFPGGMNINSNYSDPIMKLLAKNSFVYKADGSLASLTDTIKNISGDTEVKIGADLSNATVVVNGEYAYIGKPITPVDVVVTIQGRVIAPEHYTLSYANNTDVGTATVTVTAKGSVYTGTADASFTIGKGSLELREVPKVTYEFGDTYAGKPITGGKLVVIGNDTMVIPGTWTLVEGTDKATFTPDAQYADLFETFTEQVNVTKNIVAGDPVLTLTSPSPALMPGMSIRMSVEAQNSFDASITELPTQFKVTYKVNGGSPVTVNGLEFTLPASATLGDTVEVYVENVAVSGKYSVGKSNVITLKVGQVDYTADIDRVQQNLDDAIDALNIAIAEKADAAEIADKLAKLDEAYKAADALINSDIADLKAEDVAIRQNIADLEDEMKKADKAIEDAIKAVQDNLDAAKTELQNAIDTNEADIEDKLAKLDEAYKAADALINSDIADLKAEDVAIRQNIADLEDEMKKADKAIEDAIKAVQDNLDAAKTELQNAIDTNEADIEDKLAKLDEAYKAADVLINSEIVGLKAEDVAIRQNIAYLEDEMKKADKAIEDAIKAVQDNLDAAKTELQNAIDTNEADIEDKLAKLDEAYKAADVLINSEIVGLKAEDVAIRQNIADLEDEMKKADKAIEDAIKAVQDNLDAAKTELQNAINTNEADIEDKLAKLDKALADAKAVLEKADADNKKALIDKIESADRALEQIIASVKNNLDDAKEELNAAIISGDEALDEKITALSAVLDSAVAVLETADADNKAELISKIDEAYKSLDAAIKAVKNDLDTLRAELEKADADNKAALEQKDSELMTFVIVVCVIAVVSLVGSGAFIIWFLVDKKKKV